MTVPEQYRDYHCDEYFADGWSGRGHFCEESQTPVVFPMGGVHEVGAIGFLVIGTAGVDGIPFGHRAGLAGIWAFYPIDREFRLLASTIAELVGRWHSGEIVL